MGDTLFEWPSMGVYCNKSEYVFILKLGALWLYANRLSLAKFTLFGSYNNPSSKFHGQAKTKTDSEVKLSNHSTDIFISKDSVI